FTFPKEKLIYGPEQIQSRINQNPTISQQLTLWDQGGSKVIRGTLLVIPVQNAVLYVEPLYLAAQVGASLPELKRVIVAYSDHVVMEPTLAGALDAIFGGNATEPASEQVATFPPAASTPAAAHGLPPNVESLINQANQHYVKAQADLRNGDWGGYGQELKQVGEILKKLQVK
ncbi:MAG: UPF0182 family protein, partial [Acidobacteriota bacterium]|nr:UPF0182 family protein [Acidobacteriota bacterium]